MRTIFASVSGIRLHGFVVHPTSLAARESLEL